MLGNGRAPSFVDKKVARSDWLAGSRRPGIATVGREKKIGHSSDGHCKLAATPLSFSFHLPRTSHCFHRHSLPATERAARF